MNDPGNVCADLDPHGEPGATAGVIAEPAPAHAPAPRSLLWTALITVYLVWGSTYLGIRLALQHGYPPMFFPALRFLLAGGGMLLVLRLRGAPWPTARQWAGAALIGFLMLMVGNGGVVLAERRVGSGLAATAVATVPLWVAVFGLFMGQRPARLQWLGLGIGFAGVVVLNLGSDLSADRLSALVLGLAAISWALGSLISRRLPLPPGLMNPAAQMLCGGLMFAVASRLRGEPWILVPSTEALLAVLYLALFGSVIAYSAYVYLVHNASPVLATSYAYVNPVIAVLLGVAIAGESVSTGSQFAMALVLGGVALIVAFSGSAPKTPNR